jgi:hypothetical protein
MLQSLGIALSEKNTSIFSSITTSLSILNKDFNAVVCHQVFKQIKKAYILLFSASDEDFGTIFRVDASHHTNLGFIFELIADKSPYINYS